MDFPTKMCFTLSKTMKYILTKWIISDMKFVYVFGKVIRLNENLPYCITLKIFCLESLAVVMS